MKRVLLPLCVAGILAMLPLYLVAQSPDDALHAPDGNSYQQIIQYLYFATHQFSLYRNG
jgi:hypothetical protein